MNRNAATRIIAVTLVFLITQKTKNDRGEDTEAGIGAIDGWEEDTRFEEG